jgi:hypothetical protein
MKSGLVVIAVMMSACTAAPKIAKTQCDWLCEAAIENARAQGFRPVQQGAVTVSRETVWGTPTGRVVTTVTR